MIEKKYLLQKKFFFLPLIFYYSMEKTFIKKEKEIFLTNHFCFVVVVVFQYLFSIFPSNSSDLIFVVVHSLHYLYFPPKK
jgi:hypothetical protein